MSLHDPPGSFSASTTLLLLLAYDRGPQPSLHAFTDERGRFLSVAVLPFVEVALLGVCEVRCFVMS